MNASFTISLPGLWYFSIRSWYLPQIFLKRLLMHQGYIALCQMSANQAFVAIFIIIMMWAASGIFYELWNVYTKRRARWYVPGKEWKTDNVKVKIIAFVIKPGCRFTTTVYHECEIKVVCQVICLIAFTIISWDGYISFRQSKNFSLLKTIISSIYR